MVNFTFTTHNHQPLGNFDHVIEEAYEKSYRPFFELARKYPIRFATHFSGILLEWLQAKHPEHLAELSGMVARGNLEIISGGFFEPILSVISPGDQQAQIRMLSQWIEQNLGYKPRGMWLAERVWEQPLASALHDAGIRYVLLDDTHFLHAGLRADGMNGYYITEDQGKTLAVFPISKELRYTIPFQNVDETIRVLRDADSTRGTNVVSFADDGEKFGVWPQTYEHVYGSGWLEELFRKLSENASWIRMMHPSEVLDSVAPLGRVYLPNASYAEMNEWSLPTPETTHAHEEFTSELKQDSARAERFMPFVRGGFWRNFFVKYPEINQLHKHTLRTSERCAALKAGGHSVTEAERAVLAAQCNDPYWHGVFGGAYLPNLRHANFSSIVRADRLLDAAEGCPEFSAQKHDLDADGEDEVLLSTPELSVCVKPSLGGMIAEIDYKPRDFNATNTLTRREEAYHRKLTQAEYTGQAGDTKSIHDILQAKEAGLEKYLIYDRYRRGSMIEHFLWPGITADDLRRNAYEERGDFVTSRFEWRYTDGGRDVTLARSGSITQDGRPLRVRLGKTLALAGSHQKVTYAVTNESEETLRFCFASEWALNLLAPDAQDRYFEANGVRLPEPTMRSMGSVPGGTLRMVDDYLRLAIGIEAEQAQEIVRYPLESVSTSEAGFERIYQGSIVAPMWTVELQPRDTWEGNVTLKFESI